MDTVSEFHAEVPQATASKEFTPGPYRAARAEFESTTFQTKGVESTNEPRRPTVESLACMNINPKLDIQLHRDSLTFQVT